MHGGQLDCNHEKSDITTSLLPSSSPTSPEFTTDGVGLGWVQAQGHTRGWRTGSSAAGGGAVEGRDVHEGGSNFWGSGITAVGAVADLDSVRSRFRADDGTGNASGAAAASCSVLSVHGVSWTVTMKKT